MTIRITGASPLASLPPGRLVQKCAFAVVLIMTGLVGEAFASEPEVGAETVLTGETVGHFQMGFAIFDRVGTLARETEQRGLAPTGGPTLRIGFVHYLDALPWLGFGGGVRGTFGNSQSAEQEYYFNPIFTSATIGGRVPLGPSSSGLQFALDVGFTNALAKSRVPGGEGETAIFHEYGIGPGLGGMVGYRLALGSLGAALSASILHSRHWVDVEIDGGDSKSWHLGTTVFMGGLEW